MPCEVPKAMVELEVEEKGEGREVQIEVSVEGRRRTVTPVVGWDSVRQVRVFVCNICWR